MFFRYYFNAVFKLIPKFSRFDKSTRSYIHVVLSMFMDMSSKFGVAVDHQSRRNQLNCKRESFDMSSSCRTHFISIHTTHTYPYKHELSVDVLYVDNHSGLHFDVVLHPLNGFFSEFYSIVIVRLVTVVITIPFKVSYIFIYLCWTSNWIIYCTAFYNGRSTKYSTGCHSSNHSIQNTLHVVSMELLLV